ncbi:Metalloendoproteinase 3-MMP [Bienertia sinuspersici]
MYEASNYAFIGTKWPSSEYQLTYKILSQTLVSGVENMRSIVYEALNKWAQYSPFTFQEVTEDSESNLVFGFFQGDHRDGNPFDGPRGILAHSFQPTNGQSHYDATENWSDDPGQDQMDLDSVVHHEIGHLLGLNHSDNPNAVMYSGIGAGQRKRDLQNDDIQGIEALYGSN